MIKKETWVDEYLKMVEDCEDRESRLTEWETNFIDSIKTRLNALLPLTVKQIETLETIWERTTQRG